MQLKLKLKNYVFEFKLSAKSQKKLEISKPQIFNKLFISTSNCDPISSVVWQFFYDEVYSKPFQLLILEKIILLVFFRNNEMKLNSNYDLENSLTGAHFSIIHNSRFIFHWFILSSWNTRARYNRAEYKIWAIWNISKENLSYCVTPDSLWYDRECPGGL